MQVLRYVSISIILSFSLTLSMEPVLSRDAIKNPFESETPCKYNKHTHTSQIKLSFSLYKMRQNRQKILAGLHKKEALKREEQITNKLRHAIRFEKNKIIKDIESDHPDILKDEISRAFDSGDDNTLYILLNAPINPNFIINRYESSLLIKAACGWRDYPGIRKIANTLLEIPEINANYQSRYNGDTALLSFIEFCSETGMYSEPKKIEEEIMFISKLLDKGADANRSDCYGVTPLMLAAGKYRLDIVSLLLAKGHADPHAKDDEGANAYYYHKNPSACDVSGIWYSNHVWSPDSPIAKLLEASKKSLH